MCQVCRNEYNSTTTTLMCINCPRITAIPYLPNLVYLMCVNCPLLSSIPILPKLKDLHCNGCSLVTILSFPKLICLRCIDCPRLATINSPILYNLYCSNCPLLVSISSMPNLSSKSCYKCPWLDADAGRVNKLITIQRRIRQIVKYHRFVRYIKSQGFNEWFYAPEGAGGKMHKVKMTNFCNNIKINHTI